MGGQLLYGSRAIAEHLGITQRQTLHLLAQNRLPHFVLGRMRCCSKSSLTEWLARQEARGCLADPSA